MVDIGHGIDNPRVGGRRVSGDLRSRPQPALRVRHEPPTLDEAIAAARDLTQDRDQQVEIAAGLIGIAADQVRLSMSAAPPARDVRRPVAPMTRGAGSAFVVERKSRGIGDRRVAPAFRGETR